MASRNDYRCGAGKLIEYLAGDFTLDGVSQTRPNDIQLYYKLPTVLAYGDHRELALRTMEQFLKKFIKGGRLLVGEGAEPWNMYLAGWAAWGAGALGRFDVARVIMATVQGHQNEEWGGFVYSTGQGSVQDAMRTAAAALGYVWTGNIARASLATRFLEHSFHAQPDPRIYYTSVDLKGAVIKDRSDRNVYFDLSDPRARPAMFATMVAALVWIARLIGKPNLLDVAEQHMKFVLSHDSDPAQMPLATKLGWAAMMLAEHKKDTALIDFAERCGDWLLEKQQKDGSIDFSDVEEVETPLDKMWLVGWGCDAAMTLTALANAGA